MTGTVLSGSVKIGDTIEILGKKYKNLKVKINNKKFLK